MKLKISDDSAGIVESMHQQLGVEFEVMGHDGSVYKSEFDLSGFPKAFSEVC